MTDRWILPEWLFDGSSLVQGQALRIEDGYVAEIASANVVSGNVEHVRGIVSPGFVDLQVNGGGGTLLNTDPTISAMDKIAQAHRKFGTVGILPTVITDGAEVLVNVVDATIAAKGREGILGLHIEGPHISLVRRGTHAHEHVRAFEVETLRQVLRLRKADIPVMITVAPEVVAPQQIAEMVANGVVVSLGHSDADAETTRKALDAGAQCFTHLFNAMSPMLNRAPGMVGAAINSKAYAGLIVDGIHVADEMISLAIRARPVADRMFIVSDAMPTVGGPDRFDLYGRSVHLDEGRLVNSEGSLAGAHFTQGQGVIRLVDALGLTKAEALRMAVTIPAQVMGLSELAQVEGRAVQDLLVLDDALQLQGWLHALDAM